MGKWLVAGLLLVMDVSAPCKASLPSVSIRCRGCEDVRLPPPPRLQLHSLILTIESYAWSINSRAGNEPSRRLKLYKHIEGPYYGILLVSHLRIY